MSDIHALSGAYAVDAVDEVERARFERHLADCPACRAEVDSLREAAALLAETSATTPPPALRDRVLADIATVRPLPPVLTPRAEERAGARSADRPRARPGGRRGRPSGPPGRRRLLPALAAAAAVVLAVGVGVAVTEPWQEETSQTPSAAEQVRAAPDAQEYVQEFPDGSTATVIRSRELNRAVVVTHDMAAPEEGRVYALWLQHDERMVPAGIMPDGPDNTVVLEGDPATADGFGITVEPADGGHDAPSSEPLAVIEF